MRAVLKSNKKNGYILLTTSFICLLIIVIIIFCIDSVYSNGKMEIAEKQNIELEQLSKYVEKKGVYIIKKWADTNNKLPDNSDLEYMNFNFNEGDINCDVLYEEDLYNYIIKAIVKSNTFNIKKISNVCISKDYLLKYELLLKIIQNDSLAVIGNMDTYDESNISNIKSIGNIYTQNNILNINGIFNVTGKLEAKGNILNISCESPNINVSDRIYIDVNKKNIINTNIMVNFSWNSMKYISIPTFKTSKNVEIDSPNLKFITYISPESCTMDNVLENLNSYCSKKSISNFSDIIKFIYINGNITFNNLTLNNSIIVSNGCVTLCGQNNFNNSCIVCKNILMNNNDMTIINKFNITNEIKTNLKNFFSVKMDEYENIDDGITNMYNEGW